MSKEKFVPCILDTVGANLLEEVLGAELNKEDPTTEDVIALFKKYEGQQDKPMALYTKQNLPKRNGS